MKTQVAVQLSSSLPASCPTEGSVVDFLRESSLCESMAQGSSHAASVGVTEIGELGVGSWRKLGWHLPSPLLPQLGQVT